MRERREEELARYYLKYAINYRKQYPTPYQNSKFLADCYRRAADDALTVAAAQEEIAKEVEMATTRVKPSYGESCLRKETYDQTD